MAHVINRFRITLELPYSEVCMHMRVAGRRMSVEPLQQGMAQLWDEHGQMVSFPITAGEAGLYTRHHRMDLDGAFRVFELGQLVDVQGVAARVTGIGPCNVFDMEPWLEIREVGVIGEARVPASLVSVVL